MLDVARFAEADLNRTPWPWAWVKNPIPEPVMRELCESFPTDGYVSREGGGSYRYKNIGRRLIHLGSDEILNRESLPLEWQHLCEFVLSPTYRKSISQLTGLDLSEAGLQVSLYRNDESCWLPPHTDDEPKLVTQTLYFNHLWDPSCGGDLLILASDSIEDVVAKVPPMPENSIVHLRGADAWHAVLPVTGQPVRAPIERRSMIIAFYDRPETWADIYRGSPLGSIYDDEAEG